MISTEVVYVISAAVLNFCLGGIWYTVLGKKWLAAWKLDENDLNPKDPIPYLIAFIGSLWTSYGLFLIIKHVKPNGTAELLSIAIGTWLFILVGTGAKHYAFAGRSFTAFIIDYGLDLVGIILMCSIISNY